MNNGENEMTKICCIRVLGGWQSAVDGQHVQYGFGPVFNNVTELLKWQKDNLTKE